MEVLPPRPNDADLCDGVFDLIDKNHGADLDAAALPEEERVVWLVWSAARLVQNGGFGHFFERTIRGDPYFALTLASFDAIACAEAAQALLGSLAIFPGSRPPIFQQKRLEHYHAHFKAAPNKLDELFVKAKDDLTRRLAGYIRARQNAFVHLFRPAATRELASDAIKSDAAAASASKAALRIESLPHWARVALAARCGHRVYPIMTKHWPTGVRKGAADILAAFSLAEQCAAEGKALAGLDEALARACVIVALAQSGAAKNGQPAAVLRFGILAGIAKVAESAAAAAVGKPEKSSALVLEAYRSARQAAKDAEEEEIAETLKNDLLKIVELAKRQKWRDVTAVPAMVFS